MDKFEITYNEAMIIIALFEKVSRELSNDEMILWQDLENAF